MPSNPILPASSSLIGLSPWRVQMRVLGAMILREMLTRYGRNNIGFLWLFVEPMLFVGVIASIRAVMVAVHGADIPVTAFALTGYSSLLLWRNKPGRCIGALRSNLSLLYHKQVTILDVYIARITLEALGVSMSLVVLATIFTSLGLMDLPEDALQVLGGWLLLVWFGFALGITVGALSEKFQVVGRLWSPLSYVMMPLSGTFFIADILPSKWRAMALYMPQLNMLEFLRQGWFGSVFRAHYDIGYVFEVNMALTLFGLALVQIIGVDSREE